MTIIKLYAEEFERYLLKNQQDISAIKLIINQILDRISSNSVLDKYLKASIIPYGDKMEIIKELSSSNEFITKISSLLIEHSRMNYFDEILKALVDKIDQSLGLVNATVISVIPMSENQKSKAQQIIKKYLNKDATIVNVVSKSIIGGFKIKINNYLLDFSIENLFDQMMQRIK